MGRTAIRATVMAVIAIVFLLRLAAVALESLVTPWLASTGYVLLAVAVVVGLVRLRRKRSAPSPHRAAPDDSYDPLLGRRPIIEYSRDEASTSQIGDPPDSFPPPTRWP